MANDSYGTMVIGQTSAGTFQGGESEDVFSGAPSSSLPAPGTRYKPAPADSGESHYATGETSGDASLGFGSATETTAEGHAEVGVDAGAEAGEEYLEATPAQLASAEFGEETAVSDLRTVEGFEETGAESAEEGAVQAPLLDAGAEGGAQEEFLPILAAAVPALISAVGGPLARGLSRRLSPRAKRGLRRVQRRVPASVRAAAPAAARALAGGGGVGSLLPLIARLLQEAQSKPAGESGMEVDEGFIAEVAAAMEVIIGRDDRVRITQTTQVPWRRLCALRIQFPSGATYRGTGFVIGPRAVATAGHCVYLHNQGGWARSVEVIPGSNGTARPFGQAKATTFRSVGGWVTSRKPEFDYGCIVLPSGAFGGRNLGTFGFAAFPAPVLLAQPAVLAGYPGDKPFAEMWGMARRIKAVSPRTLVYDIDTMGGQSGAPVYIKRNGQRYVVGIHNYGASTGNSATRVTQPVYERLLAWSKL